MPDSFCDGNCVLFHHRNWHQIDWHKCNFLVPDDWWSVSGACVAGLRLFYHSPVLLSKYHVSPSICPPVTFWYNFIRKRPTIVWFFPYGSLNTLLFGRDVAEISHPAKSFMQDISGIGKICSWQWWAEDIMRMVSFHFANISKMVCCPTADNLFT